MPAIRESVTAIEVANPITPKLAGPNIRARKTFVSNWIGFERKVPANTHLLEFVILGRVMVVSLGVSAKGSVVMTERRR
jgi:hypothetical protein